MSRPQENVGNPEWMVRYHEEQIKRLDTLKPEPGFERDALHWEKMFHDSKARDWEHLREIFALRRLLIYSGVDVPETTEEIEALVKATGGTG